jgi:putative sigma-54 modulation protein
VKKNPSIAAPCKCEVTIRVKGHVVHVEESEQEMFAAIDVAAAKVLRQLRKYKTRVIDRKVRAGAHGDMASIKTMAEGTGDLDLDALMDDLSDDEVVRVKEIEFEPMTEEEALVRIDLLGHDFFVYTDRDTNSVCVLYRRSEGGYGLLKQPESE